MVDGGAHTPRSCKCQVLAVYTLGLHSPGPRLRLGLAAVSQVPHPESCFLPRHPPTALGAAGPSFPFSVPLSKASRELPAFGRVSGPPASLKLTELALLAGHEGLLLSLLPTAELSGAGTTLHTCGLVGSVSGPFFIVTIIFWASSLRALSVGVTSLPEELYRRLGVLLPMEF